MGLHVMVGFAEDLVDDEEGMAWFAEAMHAHVELVWAALVLPGW